MDSLTRDAVSTSEATRPPLQAALARLTGSGTAFRNEAVQAVKAHLEAGRAEIEQKFLGDNNGLACGQALGRLMDEIVIALFDLADRRVFPAANPTTGE